MGGTRWQLGIESQELTRQISVLAERLTSEDEEIQAGGLIDGAELVEHRSWQIR